MKKLTLIQKLIDKYDKHEYNKPKYKIKNLYCGKIEGYFEHDISSFEYEMVKHTIQNFAIFYKTRQGDLIHISSNSYITSSDKASRVCSCFASELKPFKEIYDVGVSLLNLTAKSKISKAFIDYLENTGIKHSTKKQANLGV